eukprot:scaffold99263_cov38-Prasinocladus_malaysianus.AAC.1
MFCHCLMATAGILDPYESEDDNGSDEESDGGASSAVDSTSDHQTAGDNDRMKVIHTVSMALLRPSRRLERLNASIIPRKILRSSASKAHFGAFASNGILCLHWTASQLHGPDAATITQCLDSLTPSPKLQQLKLPV